MQEIGEQLGSAILAYAILLQLMHCSKADCVLHIACCVGVRSPLVKFTTGGGTLSACSL